MAFRTKTASLFDELVALGNGWIKADARNDSRGCERTGRIYNAPGISYGDLRVSGDYVRIELIAPSQPPGGYHVRFPYVISVPLSCDPPASDVAVACCDVAR